MTQHRNSWVAIGLVAVLAMTGCGSNDHDPVVVTPVITEVPDSAGVSGASLVSFILGLAVGDESSEPLTIKDTFAVPPEESDEPAPLL